MIVFQPGCLGLAAIAGKPRAAPDGTYRLQGWPQLASRGRAGTGGPARARILRRLPDPPYQNTAELSFYLPGQVQPLVLQSGQINHQYRFWNRPQDHLGQDAILVINQALGTG